jgi:hypothetical protein
VTAMVAASFSIESFYKDLIGISVGPSQSRLSKSCISAKPVLSRCPPDDGHHANRHILCGAD